MGKNIFVMRDYGYGEIGITKYNVDNMSQHEKESLAEELAKEFDGIVIEYPELNEKSLGSLYETYKKHKDAWENGPKQAHERVYEKNVELDDKKRIDKAKKEWEEWYQKWGHKVSQQQVNVERMRFERELIR